VFVFGVNGVEDVVGVEGREKGKMKDSMIGENKSWVLRGATVKPRL